MIKYVKRVFWRVAKRLSYIEDARCLKVNLVKWSGRRLKDVIKSDLTENGVKMGTDRTSVDEFEGVEMLVDGRWELFSGGFSAALNFRLLLPRFSFIALNRKKKRP